MMDVSDGLAQDLNALTPAGLAPALCATAIPLSPAAHQRARCTKKSALLHALSDGEDYELLIVVNARANTAQLARAWHQRFPQTKLSLLGHFVRRTELPPTALRLEDYHGYEHLR